jgi:HK97 family phage major capsid protein
VPDTQVQTRSVDDIVAEMDSLLTEVGDADLSDEQVTRYEALEAERAGRVKREQIAQRHALIKQAAPGQFITGATATKDDDTLDRAFAHYARTGKENADLVELRAQSEGTGSEGGFLVPDKFRNKLVERIKAFGGLANVVDEVTTGDGTPLSWPTVDDVSNVGEIVQEGNTFSSGADIVFGTANLGAYSYATGGSGSTPVRVSVELLQDSAVDIEALLERLLGTRIGRIQATHIATGTGVSQPKGITAGLTGTGSIASTFVYSDFVNWIHALDPAYRDSGNCRWAFNDNSLKTIRKILDTTGRPMLKAQDEGALTGNPGGMEILGYPVTIDQGFADIAANATTNWGVFGDLREGYVVRRVRDIVLVVDPYGRAHNRQVQYSAWARMDATQQNTNAYLALTAHT